MEKHLVLPKPAVKRILNVNMKFKEWANQIGLDSKKSRLVKGHSPCAEKYRSLYSEAATKMNHLLIVNTCCDTTAIYCSKCDKNMLS